jgi:hypothetical protein
LRSSLRYGLCIGAALSAGMSLRTTRRLYRPRGGRTGVRCLSSSNFNAAAAPRAPTGRASPHSCRRPATVEMLKIIAAAASSGVASCSAVPSPRAARSGDRLQARHPWQVKSAAMPGRQPGAAGSPTVPPRAGQRRHQPTDAEQSAPSRKVSPRKLPSGSVTSFLNSSVSGRGEAPRHREILPRGTAFSNATRWSSRPQSGDVGARPAR